MSNSYCTMYKVLKRMACNHANSSHVKKITHSLKKSLTNNNKVFKSLPAKKEFTENSTKRHLHGHL